MSLHLCLSLSAHWGAHPEGKWCSVHPPVYVCSHVHAFSYLERYEVLQHLLQKGLHHRNAGTAFTPSNTRICCYINGYFMINAISETVCLRTQKNIQIHCWKTNISAFELSVCEIRKLMQANLWLIIFCQENKYIF